MAMDERDDRAERFEEHRAHLRAVAYRMLGSLSEADDAVQETWLRLEPLRPDEVENLGGWLTTVVARVSLNMLRARAHRRRNRWAACPTRSWTGRRDRSRARGAAGRLGRPRPAGRARHAHAGRAARVRAARHLRRPVRGDRPISSAPRAATPAGQPGPAAGQGEPTAPDADLARQREVVDAFLAAAREGDFDALVAVLDPDVVLRADVGARPGAARGSSRRGAVPSRWRARRCCSRRDLVRTRRWSTAPSGAVITRNGGRSRSRRHRPQRQDHRNGLPRRPRPPGRWT